MEKKIAITAASLVVVLCILVVIGVLDNLIASYLIK